MAIYQTYTVRKGDTLLGVAKAFGTTVHKLCELNGISDPDRIGLRDVLKVRQVNDVFRIGETGDTLAAVAERTGLDADALSRANGGTPTDADIGGQPIVVPRASPPAGPVAPPGHVLGSLSAKYETSGRGPGTVSTGHGDSGGASYGSYQLASTKDQPRLFLKSEGLPFASDFKDMTQGTAAFTAAWKACAEQHGKAFGDAQHAYIKRTHYDPQCKLILDRCGIDVTKRSATLRDVVWSAAVQHGPKSGLIAGVIAALGSDADGAELDKRLIDAIYLERGRRDASGNLVHFSKNSADVQQGVASRFRSERIDAQAMLTAEAAKTVLAGAVLDPPASAKTETDAAFLKRVATMMTDDDVHQLLEHYGDDETRADFEAGRKVLVALRRRTNWKDAELGKYDDPMLLVWRSGSKISVKRLQGTTEAAGAYAFGHAKGARESTVDINKDGKADMGRLRAGVYHYKSEKHAKLGPIFRARDIQVVDRDCNQDGKYTPEDAPTGDRVDTKGAGTTMYIHKGGTSFTGSAGCQTLPPADFATLMATLNGQRSLSYVLINAD